MRHTEIIAHKRACEVKFCALNLKEVTLDGDFEGYASLFNREDLGRDVILPGAFRNSLRRRQASGVKMLFQHDPNQPIGVWRKIYEDARGLFAKGRIMTELAKGREVLSMMRTGAIDGLSIGFRTIEGVRDRRSGVRHLKAVELWEISVVTFPMLPDARVSSVKFNPFIANVPPQQQHERQPTQNMTPMSCGPHTVGRDVFNNLEAVPNTDGEVHWQQRMAEQIAEAARLMRRSKFLERTKR